uniref:Uncharacterized protein n=1 Tax=viral metagenome TaxID=1070528 RepID=A0A6C0B0S0_9ZZZZ
MDPPEKIKEKLLIYKEKFHSIKDDFLNSYINYKLYPGYSENENIYSNNKANIDSIQASLFTTSNDIQKNMESLNQQISLLNDKLTKEKITQDQLKKKLSQHHSTNDGSDLLINESSELYKMQRVTNIGMVLGIFFSMFIVFRVYSKPSIVK